MSDEQEAANLIKATDAVHFWMHEYKRYLLDGDPTVLHPKAKAALILAIVDLMGSVEPVKPSRANRSGKVPPVGE